MKTIKALCFSLIVVTILLFASITTFATNEEVGITLSNSNPAIGDIVTATFYVKNVSTIAGITANLGYNPEVLQLWNKSTDVAATTSNSAFNTSSFLALTQYSESNEADMQAFETIGNTFNATQGLLEFNFSSKLMNENGIGFAPYTVPNPNTNLTVMVLRFKVIGSGDANLRIAKQSIGGNYNPYCPLGCKIWLNFGSYITSMTDNIPALTIGDLLETAQNTSEIVSGTTPVTSKSQLADLDATIIPTPYTYTESGDIVLGNGAGIFADVQEVTENNIDFVTVTVSLKGQALLGAYQLGLIYNPNIVKPANKLDGTLIPENEYRISKGNASGIEPCTTRFVDTDSNWMVFSYLDNRSSSSVNQILYGHCALAPNVFRTVNDGASVQVFKMYFVKQNGASLTSNTFVVSNNLFSRSKLIKYSVSILSVNGIDTANNKYQPLAFGITGLPAPSEISTPQVSTAKSGTSDISIVIGSLPTTVANDTWKTEGIIASIPNFVSNHENVINNILEDNSRAVISKGDNLIATTSKSDDSVVANTSIGNRTMSLMSTTTSTVTPTAFNTIIAPTISNNLAESKSSYKSNASEEISPYTGELTLRYNDINLPGRNGLDLNIGRTYQTAQATFGERAIITVPNSNNYLQNILIWDYSTYFNDRYSLGLGWSFNFPSVQVAKEFIPESVGDTYYYDEQKELYYHTGNGDVYKVEFTADSTDSNLKDYSKKDVEFKNNDTSYTNGQVTSYYSFTNSDKTKQYFAQDGRLIGIKDRFGNTIKFEHTLKTVTNRVPNGSFYYDNDMWTINGAIQTSAKGRYDNASMRFNNANLTEGSILSAPIQVEPNESYTLSSSFFPTYDEDITIEVLKLDAAYQYRSSQKFYLNNSNLTNGQWNDKTFTFSSTSATRYVYVKISVDGGSTSLYVDDVSVDKPKPLISKITDSIGREINFTYNGGLTNTSAEYNLTVDVVSPDKATTKTLTYTRTVGEFQTTLLGNEDQRLVWYLKSSNTEGTGGYSVRYYYDGDLLQNGQHESLYCDAFSKTQTSNTPILNKPIINTVRYKNNATVYTYEKTRKHLGEDGFYDTLRVKSRYEQFGYVPAGASTVYFQGEQNKVNYSYAGTYNGQAYNNETGYPNYTFSNETALNEIYNCVQTSNFDTSDALNSLVKTSSFSNGLLVEEKTQNLKNSETTTSDYTYDSIFKDSVKNIINTVSNSSKSNTTYVDMTYNNWGGLESTTSKIDSTIKNNAALKAKYTTTYYYNDTYKFVTGKEYYNDVDGSLITESSVYDSLGRLETNTNGMGDVIAYFYENTAYPGNLTKTVIDDPAKVHNVLGGDSITTLTYDDYNAFVASETKNYKGGTSTTEYQYEYIWGNITFKKNPDEGSTNYHYYGDGRINYVMSPYVQGDGNLFYYIDYYTYEGLAGLANYKNNITYVFDTAQKYKYYRNAGNDTLYQYGKTENYYGGQGELCVNFETDLGHTYTTGGYKEVTSIYHYDDYGRLEKATDDLKNETSYKYDPQSRLVEIKDDLGSKYIYEYDGVEKTKLSYFKPISAPLTSENHIKEQYNSFGNLATKSAYPKGYDKAAISENYEYNIAGNITKITDPKGNETNYEYDRLGRLSGTILPNQTSSTISYNKFGNPNFEKQLDENGNVVAGQVSVADESGSISFKTYNFNKQLMKIDGYASDAMGRITSKKESDNVQIISYDESSNITTTTSGISNITMNYDPYGIKKALSNNTNTSSIEYGYDKLGRQNFKKQDALGMNYTYKSTGLKETFDDPFSLSAIYSYDDVNRLKTVNIGTKNYIYDYYDDGLIKSITYPQTTAGVLKTEYSYDNLNRVTDIQTKIGTTPTNTLSYTYDDNSNIWTENRNGQTATYTYDSLNRLETVNYGDSDTITYHYDARGNRERESHSNGNEKVYSYDKNHRLQNVTLNGTITDTYTYNSAGAVETHNGTIYGYNEWDKLTSVTKPNNDTYNYKYDVNGLRTQKNDTKYIVDLSGNAIAETNGSGAVTAQTVYGHNPLSRKIGSSWYYYIYNAHGDVIGMVNESGSVVNNYSYDAWGNIRSPQTTETVSNPIKYAGEFYDTETGDIYLRARYYSPSIGRFTSEDPIKDGLNWYAYCGNNPVNRWDPSGLYDQNTEDSIGIYRSIWFDAEVAHQLGIIDVYEKDSVQDFAHTKADSVRYAADHPIKTFGSNATEFALFDVILGDYSSGTVYAADLSGPAMEKMYSNPDNLNLIVAAAVAKGFTGGNSRTLGNTKIRNNMVRVDMEMPTGDSTGNVHVQIKGKGGPQKIYIDSIDDLSKLPKNIAEDQNIIKWIKKAFQLLGKIK